MNRKRILVADDHHEIVFAMREMLDPYCDVDVATTGLEVLKRFRDRSYDGLIVDVAFEDGISGLETATRLRRKHKDLRILVFSATDYSDSVRQQVVDIGAVFYEKPLKLDEIRKVMEI